jgi:hypothetical protein
MAWSVAVITLSQKLCDLCRKVNPNMLWHQVVRVITRDQLGDLLNVVLVCALGNEQSQSFEYDQHRGCNKSPAFSGPFENITHPVSDAHESSILAEALALASIFLPRNRLALVEPYSITLAYSPHSFSVVPPFPTPLDATRLYSRGGRTPRRPSTRLVLDSPTRVHHWSNN